MSSPYSRKKNHGFAAFNGRWGDARFNLMGSEHTRAAELTEASRSPLFTLLFFMALMLCHFGATAQNQPRTFSFDFRGQSLAQALQTVAKETDLDIIYDPTMVKDTHVYRRIQHQSPYDALQSVLKDRPLDFITLSSGTVVIIQALKEAPAYGSYYGKIIDRNTQEPLPGASVMLADASGGTSAGPSGAFALGRLMSGSYNIIFSYVGYRPVSKTIRIQRDHNVHDRITLEPKQTEIAPTVISGYRSQIPDQAKKTISADAIKSWQAGSQTADPIRSLSLFSGVQYGTPLTDLHLQGGRRGEHRILLDGVPIYNPYSFGRLFSAFSPYAIGRAKLYQAGYEVPEGSHIAGLIRLKHDVNAVDSNRLLMQTDPLSANLRADLFFPNLSGKQSSLKIMAAARSNFWGIYKEPSLNRTLKKWDRIDPLVADLLIDSDSDPSRYQPLKDKSSVRFYDLHVASGYKIDAHHSLSGSFYTGENDIETELLRQASHSGDLPQYFYSHDGYRWRNLMGQLSYTARVSPRFDLNTQVSFTSNRLNQEYLLGTSNNTAIPDLDLGYHALYNDFQAAGAANTLPGQKNTNRIQQITLHADAVYDLNAHFSFESGARVKNIHSKVDLADLFYLPTLSNQKSTFYSAYLNAHWRPGSFWKFTLGNRLTYLHSLNLVYSEPRASIQYEHPGEAFNNWNIRLAGGLYRQFVNQFDVTNPGPTALVPSLAIWSHAGTSQKPKAWHLSGSFHLRPGDRTSFNITSYYKWQPVEYSIAYGNLLNGTAINRSSFGAFAQTTNSCSLGVGFRLKQSVARSSLQFVFGYDYSFNRVSRKRQFGRSVPPPWNQPHRLQLRTLWHLTPQLTTVASWRGIFGRSWGFRQAYYNYLRYKNTHDSEPYSFSSPENDRLSPFYQLDLSFIYQPNLAVLNLELRLNLINVLNRRNTIDWSLQKNYDEGSSQYQKIKRKLPGFKPSFSVQIDI